VDVVVSMDSGGQHPNIRKHCSDFNMAISLEPLANLITGILSSTVETRNGPGDSAFSRLRFWYGVD
jgi:hypothetical protein